MMGGFSMRTLTLSCIIMLILSGCTGPPLYKKYEFKTKTMPLRIIETCIIIPLAAADAAGRMVIDVYLGAAFGTVSLFYPKTPGEGSMPIYGNWCGPGYPKKGENPPTIDELDCACMIHDKCYEKRGYYNCQCDVELVRDIQLIDYDSYSAEAKHARYLIISCFENSACEGCKETVVDGILTTVCKKNGKVTITKRLPGTY